MHLFNRRKLRHVEWPEPIKPDAGRIVSRWMALPEAICYRLLAAEFCQLDPIVFSKTLDAFEAAITDKTPLELLIVAARESGKLGKWIKACQN